MGYLLSTVQSLWATLRQALQKPTTVEFPKVKRQRAPRIRASFALVKEANGDEACIGCKKCEKVCPSEVITVVGTKKPSPVTGKARGYAEDFTLNLQACIVCELCVQVCPTDAIIMVKEQEAPGFSRADLTLTMDKLYKNGETKERLAWSSGSVLGEHQKPPEPPKPAPKPAAPAAAAPAAAAPAAAAPAAAAPAAAAPAAAAPAAAAPAAAAPAAAAPAAAAPAAAAPAAAPAAAKPAESAKSAEAPKPADAPKPAEPADAPKPAEPAAAPAADAPAPAAKKGDA